MWIFSKINKFDLLFLSILLILFYLFKFDDILYLPPRSIHQWRQCDALSFIKNYYYENLNLFQPKIHFQNESDGSAVGEFPIIYYINAQIWKLTSENYLTIRLSNLTIFYVGLYNVYKLSFNILKNYFSAIFVSILILSSPIVTYYSVSFLTNIPALSFLFISWRYGYNYYLNQSKNLLLPILFFTISILLRPTLIIGGIPFLIFFVIILFKKKIKLKIILSKVLILCLPYILLFLWVFFANKYNEENNSSYFLLKMKPIWESENIKLILDQIQKNTLYQIYCKKTLLSIFLGFIITNIYLIKRKLFNMFIVLNSLFFLSLFYCFSWFENLDVHDYYFIDCFPFLTILFIFFFFIINQMKYKISLFSIFSVLLFINVLYGASLHRMKYYTKKSPVINFMLEKEVIQYYDWFHWDYNLKYADYESITPYLRKIGIKREDKVISTYDSSPNITLALMDVKGYSNLYNETMLPQQLVDKFKNKRIKYLISNQAFDTLYNNHLIKIGSFKKIHIFKFKN